MRTIVTLLFYYNIKLEGKTFVSECQNNKKLLYRLELLHPHELKTFIMVTPIWNIHLNKIWAYNTCDICVLDGLALPVAGYGAIHRRNINPYSQIHTYIRPTPIKIYTHGFLHKMDANVRFLRIPVEYELSVTCFMNSSCRTFRISFRRMK